MILTKPHVCIESSSCRFLNDWHKAQVSILLHKLLLAAAILPSKCLCMLIVILANSMNLTIIHGSISSFSLIHHEVSLGLQMTPRVITLLNIDQKRVFFHRSIKSIAHLWATWHLCMLILESTERLLLVVACSWETYAKNVDLHVFDVFFERFIFG